MMEAKVTIPALLQMKRDGRKSVGVVAWDYQIARIADRAGVDIVEEKRSARQQAKAVADAEMTPTFKQCAERYITENWEKWSPKHRAQWPSSLERYV